MFWIRTDGGARRVVIVTREPRLFGHKDHSFDVLLPFVHFGNHDIRE